MRHLNMRAYQSKAELRLLSEYLHGAHADQIARRYGLTTFHVERALGGLLQRLKDSPHRTNLLEDLRSRGGPRFSEPLWEGRDEVPVLHRCVREACAQRFSQPPTGRARQFCSNRSLSANAVSHGLVSLFDGGQVGVAHTGSWEHVSRFRDG
ncbi:hypothetical protein ACFXPW_07920 [Streptomyces goshikiensis]|uniref:hypothetical protein n=1 Tax=Streptomyces goshikiensis TaxID=1942 RepID=UPI0036A3D5A7